MKFEEEKKACEGIVALLLSPGKDENGEEIDLDVLFREFDYQKYLRNLEEVLEKVKTGKSFYFNIYTWRVVQEEPRLIDFESTLDMKRAFETELAAKKRQISQDDRYAERLSPRDPGLCIPGSLGPDLGPDLVSHLRFHHQSVHVYCNK